MLNNPKIIDSFRWVFLNFLRRAPFRELLNLVVPSRIELESRASETLILSIVLQDRIHLIVTGRDVKEDGKATNYFSNPRQFEGIF